MKARNKIRGLIHFVFAFLCVLLKRIVYFLQLLLFPKGNLIKFVFYI